MTRQSRDCAKASTSGGNASPGAPLQRIWYARSLRIEKKTTMRRGGLFRRKSISPAAPGHSFIACVPSIFPAPGASTTLSRIRLASSEGAPRKGIWLARSRSPGCLVETQLSGELCRHPAGPVAAPLHAERTSPAINAAARRRVEGAGSGTVLRVYTDWLLLRRCALELLGALRGARCSAATTSFDRRIVLRFECTGGPRRLAIACFDPTPSVAFVPELPLEEGPGFGRALRDRLVGARVLEISSRRNDRVLRLRMGTRSRFGVARFHDLILELIPRFGNALLLGEDGRIVSALQNFDAAANARRTVLEGDPYEAPPLDERLRTPRTLVRAYGPDAERIVEEIE